MSLAWCILMVLALHVASAVASVPMIRRRVAPNRTYGFRTPKTLSNERIWYAANAVSGRWMLGTTVVSASIAPLLLISLPPYTAVVASLGVLTAALLVAAVASFMALSRMT